ncbi:hypothetical protein K1T71_010550 [Dendrolimus kikuchii]|uniref:Uncharacterized protein n=1 Tax=Dendrolimus kikuchii TaxID=765133 RepID=A0ACC1CP82_9NEOP|nr:hypothetical protein K1T71_010550 [Dendrolimus kikuchii]
MECPIYIAVRASQQKQIEYSGGVLRELNEGDTVWMRNYASGDKWSKGEIQEPSSHPRRH